ncbi:hypothetical protein HK099_002318, partial [Clydaea vesicula]
SDLAVVDIDFGEESPRIDNVRIIKQITDDMAIEIEMDFVYAANAFFSMDVQIFRGKCYKSIVTLTHIKGKLRIRLPSHKSPYKIDLTFKNNEDEKVCKFKVDVDSEKSSLVEESINRILSKIFKKLFQEKLVYPNVFSFNLPVLSKNLQKKTKEDLKDILKPEFNAVALEE